MASGASLGHYLHRVLGYSFLANNRNVFAEGVDIETCMLDARAGLITDYI